METITIPKHEYYDLIGLYFKIKQKIEVITQYKNEQDLFKEYYNNKLEISEAAYKNNNVIEHNELIEEVTKWKSQRK